MIEKIQSEKEYKTLQEQMWSLIGRDVTKCHAFGQVKGGMSTVSSQAGSVVDYLIDLGVI
jgi:hypothetical protein